MLIVYRDVFVAQGIYIRVFWRVFESTVEYSMATAVPVVIALT